MLLRAVRCQHRSQEGPARTTRRPHAAEALATLHEVIDRCSATPGCSRPARIPVLRGDGRRAVVRRWRWRRWARAEGAATRRRVLRVLAGAGHHARAGAELGVSIDWWRRWRCR